MLTGSVSTFYTAIIFEDSSKHLNIQIRYED